MSFLWSILQATTNLHMLCNGNKSVVNKNDIRKVTPVLNTVKNHFKSPEELGMEKDNRTNTADGYKKFQELKSKMTI